MANIELTKQKQFRTKHLLTFKLKTLLD